MSVATLLGVDDVESPPMMESRSKWDSWSEAEPVLQAVDDLVDLRSWTRTADVFAKDSVLRALAKLGSARGGDDAAAVTALTWALVPGAASLAHRMSDLAENVDELVAGQLWVAARTFAWERRRSVAASILRDTMRGVQAELGVGDGARRQDRVWSQTVSWDPSSPAWQQHLEDPADDPMAELVDLLGAATAAGVISASDRELLIELAVASDRDARPARRGRAGLMTPAASDHVAHRRSISSRTVRRRAAKAIDQLAGYATASREADDRPTGLLSTLPISA